MKKYKDSTLSVWAAEEELFSQGSTVPPIYLGVTFGYESLNEWQDVALGKKAGHIYSRNTNPTVEVLEKKMQALDRAEMTISFSTGMAAISNTLLALLNPGDRVISIKDSYGGTNKLFIKFLPEKKIEVTLCETHDHEMIESELKKGAKILYLETPTNPTLKILDIKRLTKIAKAQGTIVVVDNTFATPINQRPLELGADLVLYSATKFLAGHSDVMGGILSGKKKLVEKVFNFREITGASLHPFSAYLILRGLKTLDLRVQKHNENAQLMAAFLAKHKNVKNVFYPGLKNHPLHEIAKKQMTGFGGVLSFEVYGGFNKVKKILKKSKLSHKAASLGSVASLMGPPAVTSHVELTAKERKNAGIPEGLIRYSVGIENIEDLIADMKNALKD